MPNAQLPNFTNVRYSLRCGLYLSLTVFFIWFWVNNPVLIRYNLQLTGIIVVVYFIGRLFSKVKKSAIHPTQLALDANVITSVLLLIVASTGGLNSPLFFLIYLLLFATALLFDTLTTLILTLAVTLFFANSLTSSHAALQLFSLLLISPVAIIFGRQYASLLFAKQKIKEILQEERKLEGILTEEETLILPWLSINFKNSLIKIVHLTSELLSDIGHLNQNQKEKVQSVHETAKGVLTEGEKLVKDIDGKTD